MYANEQIQQKRRIMLLVQRQIHRIAKHARVWIIKDRRRRGRRLDTRFERTSLRATANRARTGLCSVATKDICSHQIFHMHWVKYAVDRIRRWRDLTQVCDQTPECDQPTPTRNQAACVLSNAPRRGTSHGSLSAHGTIRAVQSNQLHLQAGQISLIAVATVEAIQHQGREPPLPLPILLTMRGSSREGLASALRSRDRHGIPVRTAVK